MASIQHDLHAANLPLLQHQELIAMNVPASITPYSSRRTSIYDANNRHIAYTLGSNEQSESTAAMMADCVNFVTEAESLAQTDVRVAAALNELREAVEATRAEFSESEAAA
jgi:hypothetical protein